MRTAACTHRLPGEICVLRCGLRSPDGTGQQAGGPQHHLRKRAANNQALPASIASSASPKSHLQVAQKEQAELDFSAWLHGSKTCCADWTGRKTANARELIVCMQSSRWTQQDKHALGTRSLPCVGSMQDCRKSWRFQVTGATLKRRLAA